MKSYDHPLDTSDKKPVCPECGSDVLGQTFVDYMEGKNLNNRWCDECGYSAKVFEWKTFIKK